MSHVSGNLLNKQVKLAKHEGPRFRKDTRRGRRRSLPGEAAVLKSAVAVAGDSVRFHRVAATTLQKTGSIL